MSTFTRTIRRSNTVQQRRAAAATADNASRMQPANPLPAAALVGAAANGKAERRASDSDAEKDEAASARANKRSRTGAAAIPTLPTAGASPNATPSLTGSSAAASSPQLGAPIPSVAPANSLLRQAAMDRAARHNRTATNSAQHAAATAASSSPASATSAAKAAPTSARSPTTAATPMPASVVAPPAPLRADSGSPTAHRPASSSSAGSGSGSGSGSRAGSARGGGPPSGLRPLFVPSPQSCGFGFGALSSDRGGEGGGVISTPVVYTGVGGPQASPGASPEPADEMAGFEQGAAAGFPRYSSPSNAATAAAAASSVAPSACTSKARDCSIACPLCLTLFPALAIETHASNCDGTAPVGEAKLTGAPSAAAAASPAVAAVAAVSASPVAVTASSTTASAVPSEFRISSTAPAIPLPFFPRHHDTFKLLTWNVWFDDLAMSARMDAIGSVILREMPHVVALQEVTADSLDMIRRSEWAKMYHLSSAPTAPYFTLLATRFPPQDLSRLPFKSQMARDLLCANLAVPTSLGVRRISIATSHLESERRNAHVRRQQLDVSLRLLRESKQHTRIALYVGDMNLSGTEASDIPAKYGWLDGWLAVHGTARGVESRGATMDTKGNLMLRSRNKTPDAKGWKARLDRIWIRLGSGEKQKQGEKEADAPVVPATAAAASSSVDSSSSAPAEASAPEWRVSSMERVGLCSIDMSCPKKYAQKDYKSLEADAPPAAAASSAASAAAAAASSSPSVSRGHGSWGSLVGAPAAAPLKIFPSDHFGLIVTLEAI